MSHPQSHCMYGHPLSGDNLAIIGAQRKRRCRACLRYKSRLRNARHRAANPLPRVEDRFFAQVAEGPDGCWLWTGNVGAKGYASFVYEGRNRGAHRVAYLLLIGDVPDGLQLDHLCSVRHCVNPWHLDPVPCVVNVRRSRRYHADGKCKRGHDFDGVRVKNGYTMRTCSVCQRDYRAANADRIRANRRAVYAASVAARKQAAA